jgi:hypothetical protein
MENPSLLLGASVSWFSFYPSDHSIYVSFAGPPGHGYQCQDLLKDASGDHSSICYSYPPLAVFLPGRLLFRWHIRLYLHSRVSEISDLTWPITPCLISDIRHPSEWLYHLSSCTSQKLKWHPWWPTISTHCQVICSLHCSRTFFLNPNPAGDVAQWLSVCLACPMDAHDPNWSCASI